MAIAVTITLADKILIRSSDKTVLWHHFCANGGLSPFIRSRPHGQCTDAGGVLRDRLASPAAGATRRPEGGTAPSRPPSRRASHLVRAHHRRPLGGCPAGAGLLRPDRPPPAEILGGGRHLGPAPR